jgi:nicotinamidase-related amidase
MNPINRRGFLNCTLRVASALGLSGVAAGSASALLGQSPPGTSAKSLLIKTRRRLENPENSGAFQVVEKTVPWDPQRTAAILCDMWNEHWCKGATSRVVELAPRMNQFVRQARERGVFIVHAPSSCMQAYKDHPARLRAAKAPKAAYLPKDIHKWCDQIPAEEKGKYPIDQSDGGCDCEPKCKGGSPWVRQIDRIEIREQDAISDSGVEIWNLLEERGIRNVMILGVHTNMCVLGRPFGLRQMARNGKNTVLVRDLTDTMYNSKAWPFVNHFQGTDLIIEHIEKYVCPTITSASILGDPPFQFNADSRPGEKRLAS